MSKVLHKRGDTFRMQGTVKIGGEVQDITSWSIVSQIRDEANPEFEVDLDVTVIDAVNGLYEISYTDTSAWPIKSLVWDIQYTTDTDQIISTDTITIDVRKDVTR